MLLVVGGVINLFQGQILFGVLLLVLGFAVGPGGWSVFRNRDRARA